MHIVHNDRIAGIMLNTGVWRKGTGVWVTEETAITSPTPEVRIIVQQQAARVLAGDDNARVVCPMCNFEHSLSLIETTYMATVGICRTCVSYLNGETAYVRRRHEPTIEEFRVVMEANIHLTISEQWILVEYLEKKEQRYDHLCRRV